MAFLCPKDQGRMKTIIPAISDALSAQMRTLIYFVPVLLGTGIALYFAWPREPTLLTPVLLACLFLALFVWLRDLGRGAGAYTPHILAVLACFWLTLGFTAAKFRAEMVWSPMINAPIGPVWVDGTIAALEQLSGGKGQRLILNDLVIRDLPPEDTPYSVRLSVRKGGEGLQAGARINVLAKFEPPSTPTTPGGFDFRRHAYFNRIGGYGYALGAPQIRAVPETHGVGDVFEGWRNAITAQVNAALPARQAGIVAALLTGERAAIADDDWNALRDSGLAHLLAISGSNVDMVAIIVFFMARLIMAAIPRLALYHPIKKYAAVIAFAVTLLYVLLIWPSTPTFRALLTITIVLSAILLDRSPISLRLVCVTSSIVLLGWPEQLLSPSFQLSFAAVTALIAVFEWWGPWLKRTHRDAGIFKRGAMYVLGICGTTVVATLATAPISAFHFQNLAIYGVLANALAVPLMTFVIMPLGLITYLFMPFGAAGPLLHVLGITNDWILGIAYWTAGLPGAHIAPPAIPLSALLCIVAAGLFLCLLSRTFKLLAALPLCAAIVIIVTHTQSDAMIAQDGRVFMVRGADGVAVTTTKRYARRLQDDWAQYWGTTKVEKTERDILRDVRVNSGHVTIASPDNITWCNVRNICAPVLPQGAGVTALYLGDTILAETVRPRGFNRLWQN